jgi:putative FmdB family regulatory protein
MPVYEYQCQACGRDFEYQQRMSDPDKTTCEACGGALDRLISRTAFALKGSGWYKDLYASTKPAAPAGDGKPDGKSDGAADSKADGKPADKAAKSDAPASTEKPAAKPSDSKPGSGSSNGGTSGSSGSSGGGGSGSIAKAS